jgi:hypothetical protein
LPAVSCAFGLFLLVPVSGFLSTRTASVEQKAALQNVTRSSERFYLPT